MDAQDACACGRSAFFLQEGADCLYGGQRLVRVSRHGGGRISGDTMSGEEGRHGLQRCGRRIHGVTAVTAVDVNVDEAGQQHVTFGIEPFTIDLRPDGQDGFDATVLQEHIGRAEPGQSRCGRRFVNKFIGDQSAGYD
jgi:hypothetical protein